MLFREEKDKEEDSQRYFKAKQGCESVNYIPCRPQENLFYLKGEVDSWSYLVIFILRKWDTDKKKIKI